MSSALVQIRSIDAAQCRAVNAAAACQSQSLNQGQQRG